MPIDILAEPPIEPAPEPTPEPTPEPIPVLVVAKPTIGEAQDLILKADDDGVGVKAAISSLRDAKVVEYNTRITTLSAKVLAVLGPVDSVGVIAALELLRKVVA